MPRDTSGNWPNPSCGSLTRARSAQAERSAPGSPRGAWTGLGILELVCTVLLIVPAAVHWRPSLTVIAATLVALESLVFIGVHAKYREVGTIVMCAVLGLLMAFVAYGRMVLIPIE